MAARNDITGLKFAALTVIERVADERKPNGRLHAMWRCRCICGNERITSGRNLQAGDVRSCGCLRKRSSARELLDPAVKEFLPKRFIGIREAFDDLEWHYYGENRITAQQIKSIIATRYTVIGAKTHKLSGAWEDTTETAQEGVTQ
jgi:hypothetical protein